MSKDDLIEHPVDIDTFVKDSGYLGLEGFGLSVPQREIILQSTQILKPETLVSYMGEEKGLQHYKKYDSKEVVCQIGKGSGKDFCARISFCYIAYLLHCLRDPLSYYEKGHEVTIDLVNVAVNAKQAQSVFFDPLKKLLLASPYFQQRGFDPRSQEIYFFDRPIRMYSGHSESESWEGYETLVFVLDEIAAFKADVELGNEIRNRGSAATIYNMAKASVASRFPTVGKVILLSFPRFRGDFIQSRYNAVIKDIIDKGGEPKPEIEGNKGLFKEEKTWAIKGCTWEVNPARKKEEYEYELLTDPIEARSRFMCEPPEMVDAYFRDPHSVREAFKKEDDPIGEDGLFKKWFNGKDEHMRFIHVDLAARHDHAALAMVHSPGYMRIKTFGDNTEVLPIVKLDYLEYWEAKEYEEISFDAIRDRISFLSRKFDVGLVSFDQWQSHDTIQILRSRGINADLHSVKKTDYDTLSSAIYDGRFKGYWNEFLVEEELLRLQLLKNNKVDHPTGGWKDGADAIAGATYNCIDNLESNEEVEIEVLGYMDDDDLNDLSDDYFGVSDKKKDENIVDKITPESPEEKLPDELSDWLFSV